ncbi:MAG: DUF2314 domain-containing protein [Opitutus sp.]
MRLLLGLLLLVVSTLRLHAADDHIVMVDKVDQEMNGAIDEARRALPLFWRGFKEPAVDESEFYLKLAISEHEQTEHFWISDIKRKSGHWVGLIANDPEIIASVKFGQQVVIDEARISDWKYLKAGRTKGGYTIAVLLRRLPKAEAEEFRKQLGWSTDEGSTKR